MHVWGTLPRNVLLHVMTQYFISVSTCTSTIATVGEEGKRKVVHWQLSASPRNDTHHFCSHGQAVMCPLLTPRRWEVQASPAFRREGELDVGEHSEGRPHSATPSELAHVFFFRIHYLNIPFPWTTWHISKTYGVVLRKEDQIVLQPFWVHRWHFWKRREARETQLTLSTLPLEPSDSNSGKECGLKEPWPDFSNTSKMEQLTLNCPGLSCFAWKSPGSMLFCLHSSPCYQTWFKFPLSPVTFPESSSPSSRERGKKTFPYYSSNNEFLLWVGRVHVFSVKCWWQPCWGTFPRGCGHDRWGLILTRAALAFPSSSGSRVLKSEREMIHEILSPNKHGCHTSLLLLTSKTSWF